MSACVYLLTDGRNTKVGITSNIKRRLAEYNTHNPNFQLVKHYLCTDINQARRIEFAAKAFFKDALSGNGKEWFSVSVEPFDRVLFALWECSVQDYGDVVVPAMHGVGMPEKFYAAQSCLGSWLRTNSQRSFEEIQAKKNEISDIFSECFGLGIPEHRLPQLLVQKDAFGLDIYSCNKLSEITGKIIAHQEHRMPFDDHVVYFYRLAALSSGHHVAMATAKVSMPYSTVLKENSAAIQKAAHDLGLYAFQYNEWSWHFPGKTGLLLFLYKTPVQQRLQMWHHSFRRWVMERSMVLLHECRENFPDDIGEHVIEDICWDNNFPLHVRSSDDLYIDYMTPFFGLEHNGEHSPNLRKHVFDYLFEQWRVANKSTLSNKNIVSSSV